MKKFLTILRKCIGVSGLVIAFIVPFIIEPELSLMHKILHGFLSCAYALMPCILLIIDDTPDNSIGG